MTKVALWVRLEAKPGKEEEVAAFLKAPSRWSRLSQRPWLGLRSGYHPRFSGYLMRSMMSRAGWIIFRAEWRLH